MKLSLTIAVAATFGAAHAFVPSSTPATKSLKMSENPIEEPAQVAEATATPPAPIMSQSMPFMEVSPALDGSLAADVGFDPFGFAKTKEDLMKYREAEIKHSRLAMLAAAGWPLSELFDKPLANALHLAPVVDASDRAPSILNGGLGKVSPIYWLACLGAAAAIDLYGVKRAASSYPDYTPGDLGFDPLGLYKNRDAEGKKWMETAEIKNGRLAMIAITAFAVQEFVTKLGVVDETPIFFKPISTALHEMANAGYIQ